MPSARIPTTISVFYRYAGPVSGPVFLVLLLLIACTGLVWAQSTRLPQAEIHVGTRAVQAEIASTPASRQHGLMGRAALPDSHGMLFVFDETDLHCFWMKDTPLPLSIAFITPQGRIISLADMQPYSEAVHCPSAAVRYALEMPQGWFDRSGIHIGDLVTSLPPAD